jgi:hypothetical protein
MQAATHAKSDRCLVLTARAAQTEDNLHVLGLYDELYHTRSSDPECRLRPPSNSNDRRFNIGVPEATPRRQASVATGAARGDGDDVEQHILVDWRTRGALVASDLGEFITASSPFLSLSVHDVLVVTPPTGSSDVHAQVRTMVSHTSQCFVSHSYRRCETVFAVGCVSPLGRCA